MRSAFDSGLFVFPRWKGLAVDIQDLERIMGMAEQLSDTAAYKLARAAGSVHPCPFEGGCVLSAEEHHRLAYGIMAENKELRRRVEALEHGPKGEADAGHVADT